MKNWNDVIAAAKTEIDKWFISQCQNQYARYFWKYTETTKDSPGKIWIEPQESESHGFYLFELGSGKTKEASLSDILKIAGKLPILEY